MFLYWEIGLKSLVMAENISFFEDGYVSYDMKNDSKIFANNYEEVLLEASDFIKKLEVEAPTELKKTFDDWSKDWLRNLIQCLKNYHTDYGSIENMTQNIFSIKMVLKNINEMI